MRNLLAGAYLELFQKQALAFNIGPIYCEPIIWPLSLSPGLFYLYSGIDWVDCPLGLKAQIFECFENAVIKSMILSFFLGALTPSPRTGGLR